MLHEEKENISPQTKLANESLQLVEFMEEKQIVLAVKRDDSASQQLADMGVGHIEPNRICSNAMLAAFARAKPPQPHLVCLQACTFAESKELCQKLSMISARGFAGSY